jgi:sugar/nucleoside kinase (ribokinase family)
VAAAIVDAAGENAIAVASGANDDLGPGTVRDACASIPSPAAVVLACLVPEAAVLAASEAAAARGCPFVLNLHRPDQPVLHQPPFAVPVLDTSGAGDAFSAALAWALAAATRWRRRCAWPPRPAP